MGFPGAFSSNLDAGAVEFRYAPDVFAHLGRPVTTAPRWSPKPPGSVGPDLDARQAGRLRRIPIVGRERIARSQAAGAEQGRHRRHHAQPQAGRFAHRPGFVRVRSTIGSECIESSGENAYCRTEADRPGQCWTRQCRRGPVATPRDLPGAAPELATTAGAWMASEVRRSARTLTPTHHPREGHCAYVAQVRPRPASDRPSPCNVHAIVAPQA